MTFQQWLQWAINHAKYTPDALDPEAAATLTAVLQAYLATHPEPSALQVPGTLPVDHPVVRRGNPSVPTDAQITDAVNSR